MPYKDPEKERAYFRAYRAANRAKRNAQAAARRAQNPDEANRKARARHAANPAVRKTANRAWRTANPVMVAYMGHRENAKQRKIPFLLTFEEWWTIWRQSGRWEQRGPKRTQYCMARTGDTGPYAVGNVRICTVAENYAEYTATTRGKPKSAATRKRMSAAQQLRRHGFKSLVKLNE